jgi:outer membrane lipoprotein LolB
MRGSSLRSPMRSRLHGSAAWCAIASVLLAACATRPVAPGLATVDGQRVATLQSLAGFSFRGQLAASTGEQGFSAALDWQQAAGETQAQLRGPLGMGSARLSYGAAGLRYTGNDGQALAGDAAEVALAQLLGFAPPLASLRYWLLGVPDPGAAADARADSAGRVASLAQSGWQVDYADYLPGGSAMLPGRLTLQRGRLRLKLRIVHWVLP